MLKLLDTFIGAESADVHAVAAAWTFKTPSVAQTENAITE